MPRGSVPPSKSPGEHLLGVAVEVAQLAAGVVRESVGHAAASSTKSSPTDIVTATDLQSEALIRQQLHNRCPGSSIYGEELDDTHGGNTVAWVVDPLDGTVNFLYDLPVVSVSIAATVGGQTVAGAVVDVLRGETFAAALGCGATRDGADITISGVERFDQALIGTGFSYSSERRAQQSEILNRLLPACRDIRCMGSAALNMCWVACGRLDGYFEHDTKLYDYAAGALIAQEGGATVELPADNEADRSMAASPRIIDSLRGVVYGD